MTRAGLLALLLALPAGPSLAQTTGQSPWLKRCTATTDLKPVNVCVTARAERAVAVLIRDQASRPVLHILAPLDVQTAPGLRLTVDDNPPLIQPYSACYAFGCMANVGGKSDLMRQLRSAKTLTVDVISGEVPAVRTTVPLAGLAEAQDGPPADAVPRDHVLSRINELVAPAPFRLPADEGRKLEPSGWSKICRTGSKGRVCFTGMDMKRPRGQPAASTVFIQPPGADATLRITFPVGVRLQAGVTVAVDSNPPAQAAYRVCMAAGCLADLPATPEWVARLRTGKALVVSTTNATGTPLRVSAPLAGFAHALDGPARELSP